MICSTFLLLILGRGKGFMGCVDEIVVNSIYILFEDHGEMFWVNCVTRIPQFLIFTLLISIQKYEFRNHQINVNNPTITTQSSMPTR